MALGPNKTRSSRHFVDWKCLPDRLLEVARKIDQNSTRTVPRSEGRSFFGIQRREDYAAPIGYHARRSVALKHLDNAQMLDVFSLQALNLAAYFSHLEKGSLKPTF